MYLLSILPSEGFHISTLTALFTGAIVSGASIQFLLHFWPLSHGNDSGDVHRKNQAKPILRLGGLGIWLGLLTGFGLAFWTASPPEDHLAIPLILCLSLSFGLGFADDLFQLSATAKFLFQLLVALIAYFLGFRIEQVSLPFQSTSLALEGLSLPLTVLWLVAVPNIINMIDGMDGLAGGVGVSLGATLGILAAFMNRSFETVVCFGLVGAILGFLFFNFPPAKVYMGDGGAYLLGSFFALMAIITSQKAPVAASLSVVVILLGLPIADAALAIARRAVYGLPVFGSDAEHIHHRLMTLGFSRARILAVLYGAFAMLCLLSLSLFLSQGQTWPIVTMAITIMGIALLHILGYFREGSGVRSRVRRALKSRAHVRYAHLLGRLLEHEVQTQQSPAEFWDQLKTSLAKVDLQTEKPDESENWTKLVVNLNDKGKWILFHPADMDVDMNWSRVITCFLPAISVALKRWKRFPKNFLIIPPQ